MVATEFTKFYSAKNGDGFNNLDLMADAIENLNTLISNDLKKIGLIALTHRIKEVLLWYRTLETNPRSYTPTPDGMVMREGIHHKANLILTKYFTMLKDKVEELGMLC